MKWLVRKLVIKDGDSTREEKLVYVEASEEEDKTYILKKKFPFDKERPGYTFLSSLEFRQTPNGCIITRFKL